MLLFTLALSCSQNKAVNQAEDPPKTNERGTTGERHEAPKHNAPDQDRIDSLKEEKLKEKSLEVPE